uniref:Fucosyltransferase n=1 Tax=Salvator merianae TaxID=96440 RepID=A0A8D0E2X8_SALMN
MDGNGPQKPSPCRKLVPFLLFQVILGTVFFAYIRNGMLSEPGAFGPFALLGNSSAPEKTHPTLTILLWTWPFGARFVIKNCSQLMGTPDCFITADRRWIHAADAVVVHHPDVSQSRRQLPQGPRPPFQRWVWFNLESPSHTPNLGFMDNYFNLTMSYRRDSDIFTPYGWLETLAEPRNVTIPEKSKLVAWVVSNWKHSSPRVKYYKKLRSYIPVDVYGRRHVPLPRDKHLSTLSQYKFYLAFENSVHEDYITEKLWRNSLLSSTVPVVCGPPRKNYERYLPPDSFIHIEDFPTAQGLANFLLELDRDPVRYRNYFQWRRWLKPVGDLGWAIQLCKACKVLQEKPVHYQTVGELSKWFT